MEVRREVLEELKGTLVTFMELLPEYVEGVGEKAIKALGKRVQEVMEGRANYYSLMYLGGAIGAILCDRYGKYEKFTEDEIPQHELNFIIPATTILKIIKKVVKENDIILAAVLLSE